MNPSVGVRCPHCEEIFREQVNTEGGALSCPHCSEGRWGVASSSDVFEKCVICDCEEFFRQKDFNKYLGLLVIVIAAFFVPKTYGLSMVVAFIVDLILYKRTPEMVRCYRCHSEYRRFPIPERIQLYDHYKAEMFEKPKNVNK